MNTDQSNRHGNIDCKPILKLNNRRNVTETKRDAKLDPFLGLSQKLKMTTPAMIIDFKLSLMPLVVNPIVCLKHYVNKMKI